MEKKCITKNMIKDAVNEAMKSLKKYNLYKIPIDIIGLANAEGFDIIEQDIEYDGAIIASNNQFNINDRKFNKLIIINRYSPDNRKRFTIAHELAHWYLATNEEKKSLYAHRDDSLYGTNTESEINEIASRILMPDKEIEAYLEKFNFNNALIWKVAEDFNVSFSAANVRLDRYTK